MSLLKLLSAGKSLDGSKPTASPYRMRRANRLPTFGSPKNPFAPVPKTEPMTEVRSGEWGARNGDEEGRLAAGSEKKFEGKPEGAESGDDSFPCRLEEGKKVEDKPKALRRLVKKLNPLAYLPKRQGGGRRVRLKGSKPVQGELSLEKVRVLRNELNDTDIEVVRATPAPSAGTAGTMMPAMPQPKLRTWGRFTPQMTGVAQTHIQ